jgi:predicted TIM-barrel fold metal-dependent hydrolase
VVDAIIDAHHHIWRLSETPWLQSPQLPRIFGAYEAIRRDYGIADYLADATPSGVVKSVFVQVNVAPGKEVDEVAWVQPVADDHFSPMQLLTDRMRLAGGELAVERVCDSRRRQVGEGRDRMLEAIRLCQFGG